jgi:type VI secretion system secreted protein VgrG
VELVSEQPSLDLEKLLHKPAFLQLSPDGRGIHGQIYRVAQGDAGKRLTRYSVTLRPQLAYLRTASTSASSRTSVPQIIAQVLEEHGIQSNAYASPGHDVSRAITACNTTNPTCISSSACAKKKVFTTTSSTAPRPRWCSATTRRCSRDSPPWPTSKTPAWWPRAGDQALRPAPGNPHQPHHPPRLRLRKPRLTLESENRGDALPDLEDYDYPGRFIDRERGKHLAKRALERHRSDYQLAEGKSDQPLLVSGHFLP